MKKFLLSFSLFMGVLVAEENPPLLHVNGVGKVFIKATLAEVRLAIEIEAKSSTEVQNSLSARMNPLVEALKKANPVKLTTTSFSIYPEYTAQSPPQIKSYRGNGEVVVTVKIEDSGQFIGIAMDSGATKVNGIELKAAPEEIAEANQEAIKEACANAVISAKTAFEALGLVWDEIVNVNLNPLDQVSRPFRNTFSLYSMEKTSQGPHLEGEESVQVEVALQIRFKEN